MGVAGIAPALKFLVTLIFLIAINSLVRYLTCKFDRRSYDIAVARVYIMRCGIAGRGSGRRGLSEPHLPTYEA